MHQVDLHALPVLLDHRDEVADVGVAARARVEMEHQVVLLCRGEAGVGDLGGVLVPLLGVGVPAEQERGLQGHDPGLAGVLQRLEGHLLVLRQERYPQAPAQAVRRPHRVEDQGLSENGWSCTGTP